MTGSFFSSILFHFSLVFFILFFNEIFNFSKNKEFKETPIEIVEIAKQTEFKKKKKQISSSKESQNYTPPKVAKKPDPDKFIQKVKKKEKKTAIKESKKAEKKIDRMSSILNSIDQFKKKEDLKQKAIKEKKQDDSVTGFSEKLSISEVDMIRRQFIPCWTIPSGIKDLNKFTIIVKLKLDNEGNVTMSRLVKNKNVKNISYKILSESVMRAISHPACKKIKVPQKKYEIWKNITLNFDLTQLKLD